MKLPVILFSETEKSDKSDIINNFFGQKAIISIM